MTRKIAEWLYSNLLSMADNDRRNVELEIKFGTIHDKGTQKRLELPVTTETLLQPTYAHSRTSFVASLLDDQFRHANELLDSLSSGSSPTLQRLPATRTRDMIYASRDSSAKVRISYDEGDAIIARISKRRVADLMIFSPGDLVDFRISLNVETPVSPSERLSDAPSAIRNKNRQSYRTEGMQIDLTSVITPSSHGDGVSKELEVELDSNVLIRLFDDYRLRSDSGAMDKFEDLLHSALDNSRAVARKLSR
jgi:polynucleotide 5'-triphosphatase